jgi:uncharacterized ParB-like nuclease family protein
MIVQPAVQVLTVKADASAAYWDFGQVRSDLSVEQVPRHAQIARCVLQSDDAGLRVHARVLSGHCLPVRRDSATPSATGI